MVIGNFDGFRVPVDPFETNAPLIVDSDAPFSSTIAHQFLEAICRWDLEVLQVRGRVQHT